MFDPTEWGECTSRRIFLSERNDRLFVLVDFADWDWLSAWSWSSHRQGGWHCPNFYARRTEWPNGTPFYMHVEIMRRIAPPPSPAHTIVDHRNGNTFDNRRENIHWVTPIENRANRHSFWRTHTPETAWETCPRPYSKPTPQLALELT